MHIRLRCGYACALLQLKIAIEMAPWSFFKIKIGIFVGVDAGCCIGIGVGCGFVCWTLVLVSICCVIVSAMILLLNCFALCINISMLLHVDGV